MSEVTLGRTGIVTNKNGFGALPIQRISTAEAGRLLRKAYENGITYFDTARAYSDSEEKIGKALSDVRSNIYLATKSGAKDAKTLKKELETSLKTLRTDYIDVYQLHNPPFCPRPGGEDGLYEALLQARQEGKIRFISITNHSVRIAQEAVDSGLYDTVQFPFNYLSAPVEFDLVRSCREKNIGFIAMKALSGGLITNSAAAYAWLNQYDNVLPIWGVQRESELDDFLRYGKEEPQLTCELRTVIEKDQEELSGNFCRGCGYCMPCPAGIEINNCARMTLMLRRSPSEQWLGHTWQKKMKKIEDCLHCNRCASRCPYHLDTPALLAANYEDYKRVLADKTLVL